MRPHGWAPYGFVKYRLKHVPAAKIVRGVLVRGAWRKPLRLARVRRAARRGALVVRARPGVRQRLRIVIDRRRPRTRLRRGPRGTVDRTSATFRFRADERSRFECRLDGGRWRRCRSPISYTGLPEGTHTFAVRARDRVGNRDRTVVRRRWRVGSEASSERPVDGEPATTTGDTDGDPERPEDPGTSLPTLPLPVPTPVSVVPPDTPELLTGNVLMRDAFTGTDTVITNHYAYWTKDDPLAHRSPTWEMESGCALRHGNTMWTGVPTGNIPNRDCSNGSGSEVFRLWTKRADFGDVDVRFQFRNNGYSEGSDANPQRSWDGVKVYLRRQDGLNFYTAEINRRQGNIIIQKKCPADGGTYYLLEQVRLEGSPAQVGIWEEAGGTVQNLPDGSVRIQVVRQGAPVLEAIDNGTGCAPLTAPGHVGVRGDNTDFNVDDFEVRSILP